MRKQETHTARPLWASIVLANIINFTKLLALFE